MMALPPHLVHRKIMAMPDGPEKEKKLRRFHRTMRIAMVLYPVMILGMAVLTAIMIFVLVAGGK